jgi:hypothetical protein
MAMWQVLALSELLRIRSILWIEKISTIVNNNEVPRNELKGGIFCYWM